MKHQNMDLLNKCVGNAIYILRSNQCMTGKQLGSAIGLSQQQISRYETGLSGITVEICYRITLVLQVSIDVFFLLVDKLYYQRLND